MSSLEERLARHQTPFDVRTALKAAYDNARVEDDDRAETIEHAGRDVIVELPAAFPYKPADDESVKLPIRVAWNGGSGVVLEVGPYDFDEISVQMLKQAIAFSEQSGGRTWPVEMVPKGTPNPAVIYPDRADRGVTAE